MNRHFDRKALIIFLLPLASGLAQQDFAHVEIKAAHVAGAVHMLEGRGGNIGVFAGDDGLIIIDDQFAPLAEKIKAALKQINSGKLAFVLNTHFHGDHTGGNPEFDRDATPEASQRALPDKRCFIGLLVNLPNSRKKPAETIEKVLCPMLGSSIMPRWFANAVHARAKSAMPVRRRRRLCG